MKKYLLFNFIVITLFLVIVGLLSFFLYGFYNDIRIKNDSLTLHNSKTSYPIKKTIPSTFVYYQYLHKPTFKNTVTSSIGLSNQYSLKNNLPSVEQVIQSSKLSFVPKVYAGGGIYFSVYQANRHEVTEKDAKTLARKFGFNGEPLKDGFAPPSYYAFIWNEEKEYLIVSGGSGSGGFEYYIKNKGMEEIDPDDDQTVDIAKKFLFEKGIIDENYIVSGVLSNVHSIAKRTGFDENHKEVYFRKKIKEYPVYDWLKNQSSSVVDRVVVWVGTGGKVIYASYEGFWTSIDTNLNTEYLLKEPDKAFEELKSGKGRLAWIDYDSIGISTGGYGPMSPIGNFAIHGILTNIEIQDVSLAYYHESKEIDEPEFYQPIYLFKAYATLDWKDSYKDSEDQFTRGKRTLVTFVVPAVLDDYFFETPTTIDTQKISTSPVTIPQVVEQTTSSTVPFMEVKPSLNFILKLGVITPIDQEKRKVVLSWENVTNNNGTYRLYLKYEGDGEYSQIADTSSLSEEIAVNKYVGYNFMVKKCTVDQCIKSNEVFLPQEQKPVFYLKLGTITPQEDPKTSIFLSWPELSGTIKYNIFLRNSPTETYTTALDSTGELNYIASVNRHNDNYFIVQACNVEICYPSNEVYIQNNNAIY